MREIPNTNLFTMYTLSSYGTWALIFFCSLFTSSTTNSYKVDPGHTYISFNVERFLVGEVTGVFTDFTGTIEYDQSDISSFSAEVVIKTHSLDSNNDTRDGHLKGDTWLHADKYPEIKFKTTRSWKEGEQHMVEAELTIHGETNTVQFPIEVKGPFRDPTGATTIGVSGDLTINRQDYGIQFSRVMDNGELFIGNDVKIEIRALAVAQ